MMRAKKERASRKREGTTPAREVGAQKDGAEQYEGAFTRVRLVRAWIAVVAALVTVLSAYVTLLERVERWWRSLFPGWRAPRPAAVLAVSYLLGVLALLVPGPVHATPVGGGGPPRRHMPSVSLAHDGNGTASANTNSSGSTTFTLSSLSSQTLTVNLVVTVCNGALAPGSCTRSPTSVSLPSGQSASISVGFAGGTASGTGTITLAAQNTSGGTLASSSVTVTVTQPTPTVSAAPHVGDRRDVALCVADCFESTLSFTLPPYISLDVPRTVSLLYRSGRAYPQGTLALDVSDPYSTATSFRLKLRDPNGAYVQFSNGSQDVYFARNTSGPTRLVAQFPTTVSTSASLYTAEVTMIWPSGVQGTTSAGVRIIVINDQNSPFGAGVELVGLQRIFTNQSGGVLVTEGSGSATFFSGSCSPATTCSFTSPAGEFSTLSTTGSGYRRVYPDSTTLTFNTAGYHTATADRFGTTTQVSYGTTTTGVTVPGFITDPTGQTITFWYRDPASLFGAWKEGTLGNIHTPMGDAPIGIDPSNNAREWVELGGGTYRWRMTYLGQHLLDTAYDKASSSYKHVYRYGATLSYTDAPAIKIADGSTQRPRVAVRDAWAQLLDSAAALKGTGTANALVVPSDTRARVIGPRNDTTFLSLNRFGAPQKTYAPLTPTDSAEYDNSTGLVTRTISTTGMDVRYTWSANKLTKVQNVTLGTQDSIEYETQYSLPKHVMSSTSAEQFLAYDQTKTGWPLKTTRLVSSVAPPTTHYADTFGRDTLVTDPNNHPTRWYFASNGLRNLDSTRASNLQVNRFRRDGWGRVVSTRDPMGVRDSSQLDVLNRTTWYAGPLANDTTRYQYDALNNVTAVTDATNQVYTYQRNALGWVTKFVYPGTLGADSTAYDIAGNPVYVRTRAGRQVALDYDVLGRVTKKRSLATNDSITFVYDPGGRWVTAKNVIGGSTVVSIDTIFTDSLGRTVRERANRPGLAYWDVTSSWGTVQRGGVDVFTNGSTFPTHTSVTAPDAQGRPTYLSVPSYTGNTRLTYNADQLRDTIVFPNGLRETWSYTPDHALAQRTYSVSGVRDVFDRTYRTDSLDRLVQRGLGTAGKFLTFSYDVDGRLVSWRKKHQTGTPSCVNLDGWGYQCNGTGVVTDQADTATYDTVENPTDLGATVTTGNRLSAFNGVSMLYDADGNMVRRVAGGVTDSLVWDDFGQLKQVLRSGSVIASFTYDGFGRRIRKVSSTGGTTNYVWDGQQILIEADSSANMLRGYTYYPGTDRPHTVSTSSTAYLMSIEPATGDVNGLIRASDNAVVAQYAYTPWGELEVDSTNIGNSLRWKGLVYDRETGLYSMRARYYDPKTRRFISEDPIGLHGGINAYAFGSGDPINRSDPSGLDDCFEVSMPEARVSDGTYLYVYPGYNFQVCYDISEHRYDPPASDRPDPSIGPRTPAGPGTGGKSPVKPNDAMRSCAGSARVLQGNAATVGRPGAWGGNAGPVNVTATGAAVIPEQWGGKAALRPYLNSINATFPAYGVSFRGIVDVVGGKSPIPGMPVRPALMKLNPGFLIIELPGGARDYGRTGVNLTIPSALTCPQGTIEVPQ